MKNIYSNIQKVNNKNILKAINYLKKNVLIGVPTETVYGLAGNAYSKTPIKKIYKIKKRPKYNPLIIHYYHVRDLDRDAILNKNFFKIYKKLCPGPITFILQKKPSSKIDKTVNSNLKTIAVRFPNHKTLRKILKKISFPLAIPSANKSQGISPVKATDVAEEFENNLKFILDGKACKIGIESTVVDLTNKAKILRPGAISSVKLSKILNCRVPIIKKFVNIRSPGQLKKHYSPGIPMILNQKKIIKNEAFIIFGKKYESTNFTYNLSVKSDLDEAARNLYKIFRKIKKKGFKKIYVVKIPNKGIGVAINNRLQHAAN